MNLARTDNLLTAFMSYVPEEGIVFDRFVEHGSHLVQLADPDELQQVFVKASSKARQLKCTHPTLARQLAFLVELLDCSWVQLPAKTRSETLFALVYVARDLDLIPDSTPCYGFDDDNAVVRAVLTRNEAYLSGQCANYGYHWETLRP